MKEKNNYIRGIILMLTACLCASAGFFAGKNAGRTEVQKEREILYELNRASIQNLGVEEGKTIYVIGHRSPDTDTVCSAIGYARLLTMLGFPAEARITMNVNNETAYVLEQAGAEVPPVLEDASGENIFLVDHSEYIQSAEGMQDAHIVGILDHHGIGSVSTAIRLSTKPDRSVQPLRSYGWHTKTTDFRLISRPHIACLAQSCRIPDI